MVSCRMPGWACCVSSPTGPGYRRRSPPRWRTPTAARGCTRPGRCSPIWRPRSPTGRTASTGSDSCAAIVSTCSGRKRRRPRCGGWSTNGSTPRTCRAVRAARASARAAAWEAGAAPAGEGWLHIDIDATLVIDHSDNKAGAAPTWKKTFGLHPLLAFLDRPEIAGGEALAGLLRTGNAGSNTASDHVIVLEQALACPAGAVAARPRSIPTTPIRRRCWCAATPPGPPTIRRRLPRRGRRILLRLPRRRPGAGRRGHPQHRSGLVSGDRHRRRHPRRGLGRRGHRPGQPEQLAGRHQADPA